jgi:hypothetical protein
LEYIDLIENKAQILHGFLEVNRNEVEGWNFGLGQAITEFLSKLDKKDCELIQQQMWDWGDVNLANLADPILDTRNDYLDTPFIYGKIFLTITNSASLEYLVENIHIVNDESRNRPFTFYYDLAQKIEITAKHVGKDFTTYKKHVIDKLTKEVQSHQILDIDSGNLVLNNGLVILRNNSFDETERLFRDSGEQIDLVNHNNGYKWIYLRNVDIIPVKYHFGFCFYKDKLKYIDFGLTDNEQIKKQNWDNWSEKNELSKKVFYDNYLNIILGK